MPRSPASRLRLRARSGKTDAVLSGYQNQGGRSAPPRLRFRWAAASLIALLITGACGPSVQSIYEGNVRFEHCYRLDLEVDTAPSHRRACWSEWLRMEPHGPPRERLGHGARR